ncbi:hypothetical protein T265_15657 [Opisthorchis viverrini]|uniref:Uncharacterized protein n=1 Tax=Opisthorchis viverrini TaxID=6198 RepID=A0A074Z0W8_OPIVI|nr:hypothetical protein T265_15657 [Opisthorchis viverrini]KER19112.1 hypothetical protein T265_15657 [Opisthorchis viverrini]
MPAPRDRCQALNNSIRLFRKKSAFSTSRRILQKSINRSICAASLKSNNASLAKRVAELQMEVNAERTAKFAAQMEACNLRVELVRLRAHLEALDKIKENQLKLREVIVSMFDAGMAVMRSLGEAPPLPPDGIGISDQTAWGTSNVLADTIVDQFAVDRVVDPVQRDAPLIKEHQPSVHLTSVGSTLPADCGVPFIEALPRATVTVRNPAPPVLGDSTHIPNESSDLHPALPLRASPSPAPCVRVKAGLNSPPHAQEKEYLPSPILPAVTVQRKTVLAASAAPISVGSRSPSVDTRTSSVNPQVTARAHLQRQARTKSKPIIDEPSWAFMTPEKKPAARSRRRRAVHTKESDEDPPSSPKQRVQAHQTEDFKVPAPPVTRTVEVHINRPGQVVFRADSKNSNPTGHPFTGKPPTGVKTSKSRSKKKALESLPVPSEQPIKPKSVFDLSVNQTVNTSVLPATLDELRKKELSKKQAVVHPLVHIQRSPAVLKTLSLNTAHVEPKVRKEIDLATTPAGAENLNPNFPDSEKVTTRRLSIHLSPLKKTSGKIASSSTKPTVQRPRYRRLFLDENEDEEAGGPTANAKRPTRLLASKSLFLMFFSCIYHPYQFC